MRILVALAVVFAFHATTASGQPAVTACDGDITVVRVSQIKPSSSLQAFMKAQDAHLAWYRAQGFKNNDIYSARVLVMDEKTKAMRYSDGEVLTVHVRPPASSGTGPISAKDQAGWDGYVKLYRDASDIKTEYTVCMPKKH